MTVAPGGSVGTAGDGDPVADGRQVAGPQGLVAEPPGDPGVAVAVGGGQQPGVAMGGHDPGGPPSCRVERPEGGGPARVPAEIGQGRGRGRIDIAVTRPA